MPFRPPSGGYPVANEDSYILPDELDIVSDSQVQVLARGIYRIPVYNARVHISGRFALPADFPRSDVEFLWDQAVIALPISDARSIREPVRFMAGGASASFRPGGTRVAGLGPAARRAVCRSRRQAPSAPFDFSIDVALGGSDWLGFLPLGARDARDREGRLAQPELPRRIPAGAAQRRRGLQRNMARARHRPSVSVSLVALGSPRGRLRRSIEFGAALIEPIGVHEATLRAAKYGVLLIGLCFAAYFAFELLAGLRLHALQYLLIGMANCVFYLLLSRSRSKSASGTRTS